MSQPSRRRRQLLLAGGLAATTSGTPAQRAPVRIAVDAQNPPFMYADRQGRPRGVYPVLLSAIFAELGLRLELLPLPWVRALTGLDRAEHGVGGLFANQERLAKYDYGQPLLVETVRLYVRRGGMRQFNGLQDLKGLRVGALRGWSYGDEFDKARKDGLFQVEVVSTDKQNFGKLERDYLDAVLAVEQTGDAVLAEGDFPSVRMVATPITENPSYLAFHKSTAQQELLARVDAVVARLRASGEHARLVKTGLRD
jgi:polar amino acid transport system substrate-binding protein